MLEIIVPVNSNSIGKADIEDMSIKASAAGFCDVSKLTRFALPHRNVSSVL